MSATIYLLTLFVPLGTVLLVFGMKYFSAAYRARGEAASNDALRILATKSVNAQSESAAALAALQTGLQDIKTRLASVEKILKEVE